MTEYTEAEIQYAREAAEAVHNATCTGKHDWKHCINGRSLASYTTIDAIRHLRANPRDAAGARAIFHDACCMSGGAQCTPPGDHAKRTQSKTVAALRKFLATV